jgi:hypothetical protein
MEKEDAPVLIQKEENSHMVEKDMLEKGLVISLSNPL